MVFEPTKFGLVTFPSDPTTFAEDASRILSELTQNIKSRPIGCPSHNELNGGCIRCVSVPNIPQMFILIIGKLQRTPPSLS